MRVLGVLIILAGFVLFAQRQYLPTLICFGIGAVFLGKPKPEEKPPEEEEVPEVDPPDGEYVRVNAPVAKVRTVQTDYRRLAFPVDGVMKNNDDGSSRQEILTRLSSGEDVSIAKIWFDDYLFDGKLSIRVMTDEGCVGTIRQKDVATVRGYFGKKVHMIYLEISRMNDTEPAVYRADVVIIEDGEKKVEEEAE
jgi:hypothetical protein